MARSDDLVVIFTGNISEKLVDLSLTKYFQMGIRFIKQSTELGFAYMYARRRSVC